MIGFIIGLFVGAFLGIVVMCCCVAASRADEEMERMENQSDKEKNED